MVPSGHSSHPPHQPLGTFLRLDDAPSVASVNGKDRDKVVVGVTLAEVRGSTARWGCDRAEHLANPGGGNTVGLGPLLQKAPLELVEGEPFPKSLLLLGPKLPERSGPKSEQEVGGSDSAIYWWSGQITYSILFCQPFLLSRVKTTTPSLIRGH